MYVHTGEAARLLNIPRRRLLDLLQKGRVIGAYKCGHCWIIPLYDGLPQIVAGKRGRKGQWRTQKKTPSKKTIVHINKNHIQQNARKTAAKKKPVIAVKTYKDSQATNKSNSSKAIASMYARSLEIPYPCRIVYQPDNPLCCGAKVWIEVLGRDLIAIQPPGNLVAYSAIDE